MTETAFQPDAFQNDVTGPDAGFQVGDGTVAGPTQPFFVFGKHVLTKVYLNERDEAAEDAKNAAEDDDWTVFH